MPATPPRKPAIANSDVPSETVKTGLPDVGDGASGAHFARDAVSLNAGEGHRDSDGVEPLRFTEDRAGNRAKAPPLGRSNAQAED